ncbi:C3a anaphylatoxin chemotactic receptor-like [Hoplias malabaricus]|uniref:C3a anaphylatoxin chemotactic receptor-like n=1 Tax=Hoplias malabaricus TaxID=27720 RepID=UPI0034633CF3
MAFNQTNGTTTIINKGGLATIEILTLISYITVFVLGTIGNALVIYVTGYKMKTTVNSIWFLNLAVADFLFTFFLVMSIVSVSGNHNWPFGLNMCRFNTLISVLNMFASIFLLTAISLDRCLSTWVIVWAQNKRTPLKARIACFLIWMGAIVCSIPFATYRTVMTSPTNMTHCRTNATTEVLKNLSVFRFVIGFFVPFIIIVSSYIAIAIRAQRLQKHKTIRPFRVILTVIFAFFICWLPFHIYNFCQLWGLGDGKARAIAGRITVSLAYLNSCLNPILYVFMCEEFKTKLKQSLLMVLESAFAEEHMTFLSYRYSVSSRHSESHIQMKRKDTATSLVSSKDRTTSSEG